MFCFFPAAESENKKRKPRPGASRVKDTETMLPRSKSSGPPPQVAAPPPPTAPRPDKVTPKKREGGKGKKSSGGKSGEESSQEQKAVEPVKEEPRGPRHEYFLAVRTDGNEIWPSEFV